MGAFQDLQKLALGRGGFQKTTVPIDPANDDER
jgi:hypothetical protein